MAWCFVLVSTEQRVCALLEPEGAADADANGAAVPTRAADAATASVAAMVPAVRRSRVPRPKRESPSLGIGPPSGELPPKPTRRPLRTLVSSLNGYQGTATSRFPD